MSLAYKLLEAGITQETLNDALDILSRLCDICSDEDCKTECPMRHNGSCLFVPGKDSMYHKVATLYGTIYAEKLADVLDIKVDVPFKAIINGSEKSCILKNDGMYLKGEPKSSPKLLEDIITGAVRIVR